MTREHEVYQRFLLVLLNTRRKITKAPDPGAEWWHRRKVDLWAKRKIKAEVK